MIDADKIYMALLNFVREKYGRSEAENPSYDLNAMADYLAERFGGK